MFLVMNCTSAFYNNVSVNISDQFGYQTCNSSMEYFVGNSDILSAIFED